MTDLVPPLAVCALLIPLEAALLPFTGLTTARADLPLCAVALLAVGGATTLWGAVGSFLIGMLADVVTPVHPGLFTLTSLLLFVALRPLPVGRDVRGPVSFAILVAFTTLAGQLLMLGLLWIAGQRLPSAFGWPVAEATLFTAAVAPLFYWLSVQVERLMNREDPSLLR
jgi:hypothetical protein